MNGDIPDSLISHQRDVCVSEFQRIGNVPITAPGARSQSGSVPMVACAAIKSRLAESRARDRVRLSGDSGRSRKSTPRETPIRWLRIRS